MSNETGAYDDRAAEQDVPSMLEDAARVIENLQRELELATARLSSYDRAYDMIVRESPPSVKSNRIYPDEAPHPTPYVLTVANRLQNRASSIRRVGGK